MIPYSPKDYKKGSIIQAKEGTYLAYIKNPLPKHGSHYGKLEAFDRQKESPSALR